MKKGQTMRLLSLIIRLNVCQNIFKDGLFLFFLIYLVTLSANAAPTIQPSKIEQNATNKFVMSNDTLVTAADNNNVNKMIGVENRNIEKLLEKTTLHDDNFNDKLPRLNSTISILDKENDEKKQRFDEGSSEKIKEKQVEFFTTTIETFINVDKINTSAVTVGDRVNSDEKRFEQLGTDVNAAKTIDKNVVLSSTLSSDPHFISDLSDLLMENREFDRIGDIVDDDVTPHLSTPKGRFGDSIMDITSTTAPTTTELYQQGNIGDVELIEKSRDLEINVGHEMMFTPTVHDDVTANVTVVINQYDKDEQMVKLNGGMGNAKNIENINNITTTTARTSATTTPDNDNGKAIKTFDDGKSVTKPKHNTNTNSGNTKKYMSGEKIQKKKTNLGRDGVKANKKQFSNNKSNLLPPEETEYAATTTLISSDIIIETSTLKSHSEFTNTMEAVSFGRNDDGLFSSTNTPLTEAPTTTQTTPMSSTFMSTLSITTTPISSVVIPDNASNVEHVFDSIELASSPNNSSSVATGMNEQKIISQNDVANETDIFVVEILERLNSTEENSNDDDKLDIVIEIETTENTFDNLHKNDGIKDESSETFSTTENLLIFEEISSNSSENIRLDNEAGNRKLTNKILETDSDEFFVPEDIKERENTVHVIGTESTTPNSNADKERTKQSTIDHDADTIFYISNTEVKVIESAPTPNSNQENQFFPAVYEEDVIIDFSGKNFSGWGSLPDKYEEDIILSPLKNNFDPLKLNDENLSISYVGESFIDAKESTNNEPLAKSTTNPFQITESEPNTITSDVIIQPVQLPEAVQQQIPIGVPIIAELPPQIDIKQIELNYNLFNLSNGITKKDTESVTSRVIAHSGDSLQTNHLSAELPQDATNDNNFKSVPNKRNGNAANSTSDSVVNATAYSVLDDEPDTSMYSFLGFNDVKTLLLACIATVAPLVLCVLLAFGIRYFWRKFQRGHASSNGITGDNSTDPLAVKSRTVSADELKSGSGYSINRSNDTLESSTEAALKAEGLNKTNHNGANGSVITMTLKNNHLIVETEERNDMARDARETKMHYSPSEKDGVFVVEVARGADSTNACNGPTNVSNAVTQPSTSPITSSSPKETDISSRDDATLLNNEEIQVHQPPQGISDDETLNVDDDGAISMSSHNLNGDDSMRPICGSTNTGLSQSDLSISDSCGSNQGYCYGSQQPYTVEAQGYQSSSPHLSNDIKPVISPTNSKPIIKSAIYKQESVEPASSYPEDGRPGRLRSDKNMTEMIKPVKEDVLIEEQRQIGNGEILVESRNENGYKTDDNGENDTVIGESETGTGKAETNSYKPIENGDGYDSLICLPAPPTIDEMKQLSDITLLDNNNMDSLPPPPPPEVIVEGTTNGAS